MIDKSAIIAEYATHEGDTGSPEVQVAAPHRAHQSPDRASASPTRTTTTPAVVFAC